MISLLDRVENVAGKVENATFPTMFSEIFYLRVGTSHDCVEGQILQFHKVCLKCVYIYQTSIHSHLLEILVNQKITNSLSDETLNRGPV